MKKINITYKYKKFTYLKTNISKNILLSSTSNMKKRQLPTRAELHNA